MSIRENIILIFEWKAQNDNLKQQRGAQFIVWATGIMNMTLVKQQNIREVVAMERFSDIQGMS